MSMGLEVDIKTAGNRAVIAKALGLTGIVGVGSDDTSKGMLGCVRVIFCGKL